MLRESFIPSLKSAFPAEPFEFSDDGNRIASIQMPNGRGELKIHDDGDELTFYLGDITHCHFSQDYLGDGKYSPEGEVIEEAIDYLLDLFADRVIFYRDLSGGQDGSIQSPSSDQVAAVLADSNCFLWSKQLGIQETEQAVHGNTH